jgi:hypothetical protein
MASSDSDDLCAVEAELTRMLGRSTEELRGIRRTPKGLVSLIDAIVIFSGRDAHQASNDLSALRGEGSRFELDKASISLYKFKGKGQRPTPVAPTHVVYETLMLLPGARAAVARQMAARYMVRYLGGDLTLQQEIRANRALQERLAREDPGHPLRVFQAEATTLPGFSDPRHLYIGRSSAHEGLVKVGISENLSARARQLAREHGDFEYSRVYFNAGCLEQCFKDRFSQLRETVGSQTEWFRMSSDEAAAGIADLARLYSLERKAAAQVEESLEREHKRRRLEMRTTSIELVEERRRVFAERLLAAACAKLDEGDAYEAARIAALLS